MREPRLDARLRGGAAWIWLPAIAMAVSLGVTLPSPAQAQATLPSSSTTVNLASYGGTSFDVPSSNSISVTSGNAIYGDSSQAWTLTNEGTISTSDGGAAGIRFNNSLDSTVTNTGTIIGGNGTAIAFGTGNDLLQLGSGFSFTGNVDGGGGANTLEFLSGVDTTFHGFTNFQNLQVDSGATWTNTGSIANLPTLSGGGVVNNQGTLTGTYGLLTANGSSLSIVNSGSISGSNFGVLLNGGTLTNTGTGRIESTGNIAALYSGAMLINQGYMHALGAVYAVYVGAGSSLTNSGTIKASNGGIFVDNASVTNAAGGLITASYGAYLRTGSTLTNLGTIQGATSGARFTGAGLLDNSGTIIGASYGIRDTSSDAVTIVNTGTITGNNGHAIRFGGGNDLLQIGSGAVFNGSVDGGAGTDALEFLNGANFSGGFTNFETAQIDGGATWTNTGTFINQITLLNGGDLVNQGTLSSTASSAVYSAGAGTVTNKGSISASTGLANAIYMKNGGVVTNGDGAHTGATIYGIGNGVYIKGAAGTVTNAGFIYGPNYAGVRLNTGSVGNSGLISGNDGIYSSGRLTVTNTGIISATNFGVQAYGGGTITNGDAINTNALITGSGGIQITDFGSVGGTVTNYGTIRAMSARPAVSVYGTIGASGLVLNHGAILATASGGSGVVFGGDTPSSVVNYAGGLISGDAYGVNGAAHETTDVTNYGSITAGTTGGDFGVRIAHGTVTNKAGGYITGDTGVWTSDSSGQVTNAGTIIGRAAGVTLYGGGTLSNSGSGALIQGGSASNQYGVLVTGGAGTVTNEGTIQGYVGVAFGDGFNHTLINKGSIAGAGTTAVQFGDGDDVLQIGAGAAFTGAVDGGAGANTLEFVSGANFSGNPFSHFDAAQIDSGGTWTSTGTFSSPVTLDGTGNLINQGHLSTVEALAGANATISNSGAIVTTGSYAVIFTGGGTLTNTNTGTIKGNYAGVYLGHAASISNAGYIGGHGGLTTAGITGSYALTLTNSGTIKGEGLGINLSGATAGSTITNTGTIDGTAFGSYAIKFGSGDDLLNIGDGAKFIGYVDGGGGHNTIGFVDATGTLSGNAYFRNFQGVTFTNGQDWAFGGQQYFAMDVTNAGTLHTRNGSYLDLKGTLTNTSTGTFTNNGSLINDAPIDNSGLFTNNDRIEAANTITNSGTFINNGAVYACGCGILTNSGSLENTVHSLLYGGVTLTGTHATLTNAGDIVGYPASGNTAVYGAPGSVVRIENTGAIGSYPSATNGIGIDLKGDGFISNSAAGRGIYGYDIAIRIAGTGTVVNDGGIVGYNGPAIQMVNGTITNGGTTPGSAYLISHYSDAVSISGSANLTNFGAIFSYGTSSAGILLSGTSTVTNAAGGHVAGYYGVHVYGGTNTILNSGTIEGATGLLGVGILAKGTLSNTSVINYAGGLIRGGAGISGYLGLPLTITNYGTIQGVGPVGGGVIGAGSVDNKAGGVIQGSVAGVFLVQDYASVVNRGSITSTGGFGVAFSYGLFQSVSNLGTASYIGGYGVGVSLQSGGSLTNEGAITGTSTTSVGVVLADTSTVNNSGTISGVVYGLIATAGSQQVTNSGVIRATGGVGIDLVGAGASTVTNTGAIIGNGGTAIAFGAYDDLLEIGAGGTFTGSVSGGAGDNTLRFVTGANSSFSDFTDFQTVDVQSGATWSPAGYVTINNLTNAGTVINSGTLIGYATLTAGAVLTNDGSFTGLVTATGGNVSITNNGTMTSVSGLGVYLTAGGNFTNTGVLSAPFGPAAILVGAGTISNSGSIGGTSGVTLFGGGDETLLNSGTITGNYGVAVQFLGSGNNTLIVTPSARFDGAVEGSPYAHDTLAFDGTNGLLTGDTAFTGFENTSVLSGASWTFAGDLTFENLSNAGSLTNSGTLGTGSGTFTNTGYFNNAGQFTGALTNSGSVFNFGTLDTSSAVFTNSGSFTNNGNFLGNLVNTGFVNNNSSLDTGSGTLTNSGTFTNSGSFTGYLVSTGLVTNQGAMGGAITLNAAGSLNNSGTITSQYVAVAIYNNGSTTATISNVGAITSTQGEAIAIQGNGVVLNQGVIAVDAINGGHGIYVYGTGSINNGGTIRGSNYAVGVYIHAGTVTNNAGGVIFGGFAGVAGSEPGVAVSNGGTITGTQFGVLLNGGAIDNSGSIGGGAAGVGFYGTGTLTNRGTISGTQVGALLFGAGGSVNNSGVISGQYGIVLYGGGTITNTGSISAAAGSSAVGFGFGNGSLVNSGTVHGSVFFFYGYTAGVTNRGLITADGVSATVQMGGGGTLTNSGTIIATDVNGEAVVLERDGTVTNSGTILAAQIYGAGVTLRDGRGTLINTGLVSGGQYGVSSFGAPVVVNNQGSIANTNGYGTGVNLSSGGTVINSGVISGGRDGVFIYGQAGTITNQGKITGVYGVFFYGSNADTLTNAGTIIGTGGTAVNMGAGDDLVVIAPTSVFTGLVDGGDGYNVMEFAGGTQIPDFTQFPHFSEARLDANTSWTFNGTNTLPTGLALTNNGTIVNNGTLNGSRFTNAGTFANSGVIHGGDYGVVNTGGTLINSGTIIGTLDGVSQSGGSLTNTGLLQGGRYGLRITGAGTATNSGTIVDDAIAGVSLGTGAVLTNNAGATISGVTGAIFTGTGATLTNNGTITGTGGGAVMFDAGVNTLVLGTTSVLNGSINGGGGAGRIVLTGTGNFRTAITNFGTGSSLTIASGAKWSIGNLAIGQVVNSGTLNLGSTPATTTITGGFAQTSTGTLTAVLDNSGASSTLKTTGAASLDGTLQITMPTLIGAPVRYTIVNATGGVTGTFSSLLTDTSVLGSQLSYDANDAYVTIFQRKLTPPAGVVETQNQLALSSAFDAAVPSNAMGFGTALGIFNALPAAGFVTALNQLSGEPLVDVGTAALLVGRQFLGEIRHHARTEQAAPGSWTLWGQAFLQSGHLDGDGNAHRMSEGMTGGVVGADYQVWSTLRLGGVLGYGHSRFNVEQGVGSGEADYTQAALTASFAQGPLELDAAVGGVFGNGSTSRTILEGTTLYNATARQRSTQVITALEAGYRMTLTETVDLTPFARLQTGSVRRNAFSESGADIFNLAAPDQTENAAETILGVRFDTPLMLGMPLKLDGRLGWSHELAGIARLANLSLSGNPFTIAGASLAGDAADIGLGLSTPVFGQGAATLGYDGSLGGNGESHAVRVGLRFTW